MNYYNEIKNELVNNEIYKSVKNYSENRHDLTTYYNVGKLLLDAGKHYGESIIKKYSIKLTKELGKGYTSTRLKYYRKFYEVFSKSPSLSDKLSFSHYCEIIWLDINHVNYYIQICNKQNLSVRQLREKVKNKEYERLPENTKQKLINDEKTNVEDFIKNPIIINNKYNYKDVSEKMLQELILDNIEEFMSELGDGFCFIGSEYKIKLSNTYNYIDLLLFNIKYNCYIVIELKVTELKKEHIGQIQVYMNYIDKNIKTIYQDKTIGLIICRKNNEFIIEYTSDDRILYKEYVLK